MNTAPQPNAPSDPAQQKPPQPGSDAPKSPKPGESAPQPDRDTEGR